MSRLAIVSALLCAVAAANAAVTPIDEFEGQWYEGFENLLPLGGYPGPLQIMEENVTFGDTIANYFMIANSLYSFPNDGYIFPYNGNLMLGSVTGWAYFSFDVPVSEFGLYIGTVDHLTSDLRTPSSGITFYDADGMEIETQSLTINIFEWGWHGWHSDVPISYVEIRAAANPGFPLVFDDAFANPVPEPASLGLLLAATTLLRRRG